MPGTYLVALYPQCLIPLVLGKWQHDRPHPLVGGGPSRSCVFAVVPAGLYPRCGLSPADCKCLVTSQLILRPEQQTSHLIKCEHDIHARSRLLLHIPLTDGNAYSGLRWHCRCMRIQERPHS
jgi:hypothetical protein